MRSVRVQAGRGSVPQRLPVGFCSSGLVQLVQTSVTSTGFVSRRLFATEQSLCPHGKPGRRPVTHCDEFPLGNDSRR
jgi:hypothetical protein